MHLSKELRCCEIVMDSTGWHSYQCSRKGTLKENGKLWCTQHAPSSVKKRRDAWQQKCDQESEQRDRTYRRDELRRKIADRVLEIDRNGIQAFDDHLFELVEKYEAIK